MQSAEEFMREFLAANVAEVAREVESRNPFRQKFYAAVCSWDSRKGAVKTAKSETVRSISKLEGTVLVVTCKDGPTDVFGSYRYHLQPNGQSWHIHSVDWACRCSRHGGSVDPDCFFCGGTGWADGKSKERRKPKQQRPRREPPPDPGKRF